MKNLRSEEEIISSWNSDKPIVSICCITYNHEKYIEKALIGFLTQISNYPFEILIHDDASTDKTISIIQKYHASYPSIIKPIYQTENQYSKGVKINSTFNYSRAKGKYIALCEGDDYWSSNSKLQIQLEFMENNPECSMSFHAADVLDLRDQSSLGVIRPYNKTSLLPENQFFYGGGSLCPTASIVFVREYLIELPRFYTVAPVGDHPLAMLMCLKGRIGYIDKLMSVRSLWAESSFNTNMRKVASNEKKILHYQKIDNMLEEYATYANGSFNIEIIKHRIRVRKTILNLKGEKTTIKDLIITKYLSQLPFGYRIKYIINSVFPRSSSYYSKFKKTLLSRFHKTSIGNPGASEKRIIK